MNKKKKIIRKMISNILLSMIFLFLSLIFIKSSENNKSLYKKYFFEDTFSFNKFNNWYQSSFGSSFKKSMMVLNSNNTDIYSNYEIIDNGTKFIVNNNTPITTLKSGILIYKGEKEGLNTIIIQGVDGYDYWYMNIINSDIKIYDYVTEGEIIGESENDYFYLYIKKNNEYITYETYKS